MILAPVQPFIEYEVIGEHADHNKYNSFSGPPTTETDVAWEHLLKRKELSPFPEVTVANDASQAVAFNATLDELRMANESIDGDLVELDGGGYLASLGAYHELHCLVGRRHIELV